MRAGSMRVFGLILLLAAPASPLQDAVPDYWKQLDGEDAALRKAAFDELRKAPEAPAQTRLRKTLQSSALSWLRKAATERTRALRSAAVASRKGFNPVEFAARQKEMLALLAAGNTKAMETPVKKMWKEFYFDPADADKDEKFAAARDRSAEYARWQKEIGAPDKELVGKTIASTFRMLDDNQLFQLLPKRDFTIMSANAALRDTTPAGEYQQAWMTNLYRMLLGKAPLKLNPKLCDAAREHSQDMVEKDFFDHVSPVPGKRTVGDRARLHGASAGGENIHMGSDSAEGAFWSWFGSLGHHRNMLNDYAEIGVGNYVKHWTQMFG
jgi:hypothetical protein